MASAHLLLCCPHAAGSPKQERGAEKVRSKFSGLEELPLCSRAGRLQQRLSVRCWVSQGQPGAGALLGQYGEAVGGRPCGCCSAGLWDP